MKEKITEKIRVSDPLDKKAVVTFVGPTGVGKTTTIAKLAAVHALKRKKRVALLTMDTYRIAAAEQLKVYGRIIGAPVEVARNAGELARHISSHRDKDIILIDTAGRNPRNRAHMEEIAAIERISPDIKFNLVLSAQTRDEGLYDCVRSYGNHSIDSLTFTKLDEGRIYGPILNTMLLARKPVAYLTNGQNVPDDIEIATKQRLVKYFMPN
jgi:flagellar biosynthesis protein FlhF